LSIPLRSTTALHGSVFEASFQAQPRMLTGESRATITGQTLELTVPRPPPALRGKTLEFFPEIPEVIETAGEWTQRWQGEAWTARVPLSPHRSQSPAVFPVVLGLGAEGWRTELHVSGPWPPVAQTGAMSPALEAALRGNAASTPPAATSLALGAALLGALLGGLILNLMPCVFPILAMKVVGFTRHAADRRAHRATGLAYTAGVMVSFLALGALMLALRAAGEQLGWGFQLQSPLVVAALAALFTLIALNLTGLFEVGHFLPSRVAALQARHPAANSFLSGVLAVAVASPCTAPFMGASLGLAIGLPASQALLVFGATGLGMALPYLAASVSPALAQRLPRPGPWMDTFRKLMAFPMFATVAWLVWVLGQQAGIDGAGTLLGLLIFLSMAVWALTLRGRVRAVLAAIAGALFIALAWMSGASLDPPASSAQPVVTRDGPWQPWASARVDQLLNAGQPVFVDFTAAWCITCQYNKKATLERQDVLQALADKRVALLRADWTRRDPAITAALANLGRTGVPVYVLYKPGAPPVVLTEVLDAGEMRAVLARL